MISILDCAPQVSKCRSTHITFIRPIITSNIEFYIDIFDLLILIDKKNVSSKFFLQKLTDIRKKNRLGNYKTLLNQILKPSKKVNNEGDLIKLKYKKNRVVSSYSLSTIYDSLKYLLTKIDFLIGENFEVATARKVKEYNAIILKCKNLYFLAEKIFDYVWFRDLPTNGWGAYMLTKQLNINCCPYCNAQYTFTITGIGNIKLIRPQLDHFLPKSEHPFLALSFFNLIPCCSNCNSSLKGGATISHETHFSPYSKNKSHSNTRFTYIPGDYNASVGLNKNIRVELLFNGNVKNNRLKTRVKNTINLLSINDLYSLYSDTVQEIIQKRHYTSDKYIKVTQNTFKALKLSKEDAYRLAFGNYYDERDFSRRPLSKLTKDLAIELNTLIAYKTK